jgi:deoxyguanosine kinase
LNFRHISIEGPIGVGKSALAEHLAGRLDAALVLEERENPFLAALQSQLFYLLARHRQQGVLRQTDLFSQLTIADYLFDRDKIYAYLNLDDNELFIYQRLFELLARDLSPPDLVVYLQAPTDLLLKRLRERARETEDADAIIPDATYLQELNEAYQHFFFHYTASPLLVVETSSFGSRPTDAIVDDLIRQIEGMTGGTRYYVPRA